MKNITVLGSTGSIGAQTLEVLRALPETGRVAALCAKGNGELLLRQALEFHPALVCVEEEAAAKEMACALPRGTALITGPEAACAAAAFEGADTVVNGISGFAGTKPLLAALTAGKTVALANKESIVCAHALVERAVERGGGTLIPVDSEQSALFQCLAAGRREDVKKLILTASGGPFRTLLKEQLACVTPEMASCHPTWKMGAKITIDSATLFNKGLEIMEASYLFGIPGERIEVLVHPESMVHSMVEYRDCSVIAQLSAPDMRLAIHYALTWPARSQSDFGALDLTKVGKLTFERPDGERFPAIPLAYEALRRGGGAPAVYNGANEAAVELFRRGEIGFLDIPQLVALALSQLAGAGADSLEELLDTDHQARRLVFGKVR